MTNVSNERPKVVLVNRCFVIHKGKLLLVKRSSTDTHHPGMWEGPGGKLDEGQDLTHALEREVMEETGLLVSPIHPLVFADSYVIGSEGKYKGLPYVVLFGVMKSKGGVLKLSDEHDDFEWVSYKMALDYDLTPEVRKALIVLKKPLKKLLAKTKK
jgi:8-oxo-dGTP diphosphatase